VKRFTFGFLICGARAVIAGKQSGAMRNLVATGGIANIGQARTNRVRFMSTCHGREQRVILGKCLYFIDDRSIALKRGFSGEGAVVSYLDNEGDHRSQKARPFFVPDFGNLLFCDSI
jgi:hypothetical protein